jgi:hypothetical protein
MTLPLKNKQLFGKNISPLGYVKTLYHKELNPHGGKLPLIIVYTVHNMLKDAIF